MLFKNQLWYMTRILHQTNLCHSIPKLWTELKKAVTTVLAIGYSRVVPTSEKGHNIWVGEPTLILSRRFCRLCFSFLQALLVLSASSFNMSTLLKVVSSRRILRPFSWCVLSSLLILISSLFTFSRSLTSRLRSTSSWSPVDWALLSSSSLCWYLQQTRVCGKYILEEWTTQGGAHHAQKNVNFDDNIFKTFGSEILRMKALICTSKSYQLASFRRIGPTLCEIHRNSKGKNTN